MAVAVTRHTEAPADDEWPLTAVFRRQWMMSCVRRSTKVLSARLFLLEEGLGYGLVVPFPAYGFATLVSNNENLNSPKQPGHQCKWAQPVMNEKERWRLPPVARTAGGRTGVRANGYLGYVLG